MTQWGEVVYHHLYHVISGLRVFYVFCWFDIDHQFNWVVTSEQADGPLCQLRLTGAMRSSEAFHFGLLLTSNPARQERRGDGQYSKDARWQPSSRVTERSMGRPVGSVWDTCWRCCWMHDTLQKCKNTWRKEDNCIFIWKKESCILNHLNSFADPKLCVCVNTYMNIKQSKQCTDVRYLDASLWPEL